MQSLADLQSSFTHAMTSGDDVALVAKLGADARAASRLSIHLRHYDTSLTTALVDKFPACRWLVGSDLLRDAARAYVHARPPSEPCIAEYGRDFPQVLAAHGQARALPYLETFAALELAVAQVSIDIDRPPLAWSELSPFGLERLLDSALVLQPGLRYVYSAWRVDELMATYLRGTEPELFVLEESSAHIEVRGARGDVRLARLDGAVFRFRSDLAAGCTIGDAADAALEVSETFDAGTALCELIGAGLVVRVGERTIEETT